VDLAADSAEQSGVNTVAKTPLVAKTGSMRISTIQE
jgi:hypothetical protein